MFQEVRRASQSATNTMSGLVGWMITFPIARESRSPTFFQVLPPSKLLYTPSPCEISPRMHASPVPAYRTLWLEFATARLPIEDVPSLSKVGDQVMAPSTDFQTPPPVAPK